MWETSWKTSVNSCGPRHPEWETSVGDKWETSVNSCGPRHPEWETSVEDKCESEVGDKCKIMRLQDTQSGRQVWETSGRQV